MSWLEANALGRGAILCLAQMAAYYWDLSRGSARAELSKCSGIGKGVQRKPDPCISLTCTSLRCLFALRLCLHLGAQGVHRVKHLFHRSHGPVPWWVGSPASLLQDPACSCWSPLMGLTGCASLAGQLQKCHEAVQPGPQRRHPDLPQPVCNTL